MNRKLSTNCIKYLIKPSIWLIFYVFLDGKNYEISGYICCNKTIFMEQVIIQFDNKIKLNSVIKNYMA